MPAVLRTRVPLRTRIPTRSISSSPPKVVRTINQARNRPAPTKAAALPPEIKDRLNREIYIPKLVIPIPREHQPTQWRPWLQYHYHLRVGRLLSTLIRSFLLLRHREHWYSRTSSLDLEPAELPRVARELHARLGRAISAQYEPELRRVCTIGLFYSLRNGSGPAKPPPEGLARVWDLAEEDDPKQTVLAHSLDLMAGQVFQQNAVVAIESTQTLTEYEIASKKVVRSLRQRKRENVVIMRTFEQVSPRDRDKGQEGRRYVWKKTPWRIWGTLEPSPVQDVLETQREMAKMQQEMVVKKYGFDSVRRVSS